MAKEAGGLSVVSRGFGGLACDRCGADQIGGAERHPLGGGERQEALMVFGWHQPAAAAAGLGQRPAMDGAAVQAEQSGERSCSPETGENGVGGFGHGEMGRGCGDGEAMHYLQ